MNPLIWIYNVISGRVAHWNEANNSTFNRLWTATNSLSQSRAVMVRSFLLASQLIVEKLIAPNEPKRIFPINVKALSSDDFKRLHGIHVGALGAGHICLNRRMAADVRAAIERVFQNDSSAMRVFDSGVAKGTTEIREIAATVWDLYRRDFNAFQASGVFNNMMTGVYTFPVVFSSAAAIASKGIQSDLVPALRRERVSENEE